MAQAQIDRMNEIILRWAVYMNHDSDYASSETEYYSSDEELNEGTDLAPEHFGEWRMRQREKQIGRHDLQHNDDEDDEEIHTIRRIPVEYDADDEDDTDDQRIRSWVKKY